MSRGELDAGETRSAVSEEVTFASRGLPALPALCALVFLVAALLLALTVGPVSISVSAIAGLWAAQVSARSAWSRLPAYRP